MPDIDLEYLNDRYLAFVLPLELRRLVGQGVKSWFLTGNEKEPVLPLEDDQEDDNDAFLTILEDLEFSLRSAIGRFRDLTGCWLTNKDQKDKLQNSSEKLINANQQYVATRRSTWLDERHQCYIKIANHYSYYPNIPSRLHLWDPLGDHTLDHDDEGIKGGNRIMIKDRSAHVIDDIQIKKKLPKPIISRIKTKGWYNAERQAISQATSALQESLNAPHRQLFELGSLLADVNWGNSWFDSTIDPDSRRSLTTNLSRDIKRIVTQVWYLISDKVSTKVRRLTSQATISSAIKVANEICELCHAGLYRSKNGWFKGEYERILLAYDITHLEHFTESQIAALTTRLAECLSKHDETLMPIDSITRLNQLASSYPMRGKVLQIGLEANHVGDPSSSPVLQIWNRISAIEQENGQFLVSLEDKHCEEVDREVGVLVKMLVDAKGCKVTANSVAIQLGLKNKKLRMDRLRNRIPSWIRRYVKSGGRAGTRLVSDPNAK